MGVCLCKDKSETMEEGEGDREAELELRNRVDFLVKETLEVIVILKHY